MANTSSRTLRLLSLLQTHRYWPGAELAERLEVSVRTLRRDVDRLRELGYPVQAQPGVDGGYQLAPGAALPPLVLDDDEAVALAVGLLTAAQSPVAGTAESSVRALAKVVAVMPKRLRRRVDALRSSTESTWSGPGPTVDPGVLTAVAQACRDTERVEFDYTAADGTALRRKVEPLRLISLGRRWYLVGYDLIRNDWRTFRLDRLTAPSPTGARFAPRRLPAADAAEFVRSRFETMPRAHLVTAWVEAPAEQVRAKLGRWATVDEGERRCRVRIDADSFDWAALALGTVGAPFRVEGPTEFVALLRDWSARFADAAGGD
ncbi:YafY family protein [Speluncibacter jeojiensis]|uniref:YafY family transcriptional regulator n=1 Tax=Speluncibacter jeojiensis TaxID=2710754 RepID=A0A9X4M2L7_9ACTN|nr:YafY family transcriptional regulator [Corynebacteriales bacterium D3-21]